MKPAFIRASLEALYATQLYRLLQPITGGVGVCFMLHHVRPRRPRAFDPNAHLEVTPEFLELAIDRTRRLGFEIVSLDEAHERLTRRGTPGRFAVFTLDDGYRDNVEQAWPVFRAARAPFTVFVATGLIDRTVFMWWRTVEDIIRQNESLPVRLSVGDVVIDTSTREARTGAYAQLTDAIHAMGEDEARQFTADLAASIGLDPYAITDQELANWNELQAMAADPLCTIGAHTVHHPMLARLPRERALWEMDESRARIASRLGTRPRHFAFPYGYRQAAGTREFELARDLGFTTAVSTRPGHLFAEHRHHLTALPRVSLNGHFQSARFVDVLASGAPFALFNRFRTVNVA